MECGLQSVMLTFHLIPSKLNKLNANKTPFTEVSTTLCRSQRDTYSCFWGSNGVQDYFLKFQA